MTINPRRRTNAIHGEVAAAPPQPTATTQQGHDCQRHDGIPADLRCCVRAGHQPPCVAAAAHVAFGRDAVVLVLPSQAEIRRAQKIAAMRYCARILDRAGARDGAGILRTRAVAVRSGLPDAPVAVDAEDADGYPSVVDVLSSAQAAGEAVDSVDGEADYDQTDGPTRGVPDALDTYDDWPEETVVSDISDSLAVVDGRTLGRGTKNIRP